MLMKIEKDEYVDWFRVLVQLERKEYPLRRIEDETGLPRSTLHGWKQGSQAKLEDAMKVLGLWMQVTRQSIDSIPVYNKYQPHRQIVRDSDTSGGE